MRRNVASRRIKALTYPRIRSPVGYLVTQYSSGMSLQKRIQDQGPLELKEILRISLQTARGLAAAHDQGLVHRDVKPSNILLDGTVERALLTDFGLARAVDDASITRSGTITGTPQFMAPEQARAETVDQRSDLFSLGAVMYAMCTGRPPFRADSSLGVMRLITDKMPQPIQAVLPRLLDTSQLGHRRMHMVQAQLRWRGRWSLFATVRSSTVEKTSPAATRVRVFSKIGNNRCALRIK